MPELITAASPIEIQAKADEAGLSQDARDAALRLFHDLTSRIGLAAVGLHRDDGEEWPRHRFYFGPGGGSLADLAETLRAAATAQGGAGGALDPAPFTADFNAAMDDDLDSPRGLVAFERLAAEVLSAAQTGRDVHAAQAELRRLAAVFGLRLDAAAPEPRVTVGWDQHLQRFTP